MTRLEASRLREQMLAVKVWIEHFQADAISGLVPSKSCLIAAHAHADNALVLLDQLAAPTTDLRATGGGEAMHT